MIAPDAPGAILAAPVVAGLPTADDLRGFGGLHGGLSLALVTSAMRVLVPGSELRSVTGRFARPIRDDAEVRTTLVHRGWTVAVTTATASSDGTVQLNASAVFGRPGDSGLPTSAPVAPAARVPDACEIFTIPPEFVPFARHSIGRS
jgi:hypothetical protein